MKTITKRIVAPLVDFVILFTTLKFLHPIIVELSLPILNLFPDFPILGMREFLFFITVFLLWPILFAFTFSAILRNSPGKYILGLKVYTNVQDSLSIAKSTKREFIRILEVITIGVGLMSLYNILNGKKSFSDMLCNTDVLEKSMI